MIDFPEARPGMEVTLEIWNQARTFVRSTQLQAGPGIRLAKGPHGTIISAAAGAAAWSHPFQSALRGQTGASVASGWLNGSFEPEIKNIPLSGDEKNEPPVLEWANPKLAPDGTGYIAIQVQFGDKWEVVEKHGVTILQCAYIDRDDGAAAPAPGAAGSVPILSGRRARWGLARLRKGTDGQLSLFQIVHGDLDCQAQPKSAASEEGRVFFW